jgi:hypothetical protein
MSSHETESPGNSHARKINPPNVFLRYFHVLDLAYATHQVIRHTSVKGAANVQPDPAAIVTQEQRSLPRRIPAADHRDRFAREFLSL